MGGGRVGGALVGEVAKSRVDRRGKVAASFAPRQGFAWRGGGSDAEVVVEAPLAHELSGGGMTRRSKKPTPQIGHDVAVPAEA